ncbi:monovalent cation/H(+) antiporter subunit G [Roseinatronobacter bogoriensis]|uniref:Sodium:proton antiporter n=1 Tax=Roseinatronobacter bogoriensis subsp. barguzinensis TaxID=441209 RepID=A0A2K8KGA1_9RHOB|nr:MULTISPECIES: monovalent cation/H(+) antiporter subunit G [Rhodobaca]ATX65818.1 sodium:proton antiporter [Rhodobaca barguzinensis]MBB4208222.1 multicomponent Na+:H+ antiporter subunit G [Rhodobaca bogoriensis DSM 18756]TDW38863.1 multicomponent Na+:H+ antiporter subunit G [Rhodobaca barguzinensis]TDY68954.1 multicomponent Na+:H+ antiporter subunit G [Rhodobaca bogoriensis DSM 18756]
MIDILVGLFLIAGAAFVLIAAIGIVRLPDLLTRMHASTKAGTLGALLVLVGLAFHEGSGEVLSKVVATSLFLLLTAPIAAHMIGRAHARVMRKLKASEQKDS